MPWITDPNDQRVLTHICTSGVAGRTTCENAITAPFWEDGWTAWTICPDCAAANGLVAPDDKKPRVRKPSVKKPTPADKRTAGVELEYNMVSNVSAFQRAYVALGVNVHGDGSCGEEAVTPPLAGSKLRETLQALVDAFNASGGVQDGRCGTHVHVDMSDYNIESLRRLCLLYAKVEPFLYLLAGQHRANNNYCRPNGHHLAKAISKYHPDFEAGVCAGVYYENDLSQAATIYHP